MRELEHDPNAYAEHRIGSFVERGATAVIFANDSLHRIVRPNPLEVGPGEPALYTTRPVDSGPAVAYDVDPVTGCITAITSVADLVEPSTGELTAAPAFPPPDPNDEIATDVVTVDADASPPVDENPNYPAGDPSCP